MGLAVSAVSDFFVSKAVLAVRDADHAPRAGHLRQFLIKQHVR